MKILNIFQALFKLKKKMIGNVLENHIKKFLNYHSHKFLHADQNGLHDRCINLKFIQIISFRDKEKVNIWGVQRLKNC